jgi:hypothetical protein
MDDVNSTRLSPLAPHHHVAHEPLRQVNGPNDVEIDEVQLRVKIRVTSEVASQAHSGIVAIASTGRSVDAIAP